MCVIFFYKPGAQKRLIYLFADKKRAIKVGNSDYPAKPFIIKIN
jgi:hypothetical protein